MKQVVDGVFVDVSGEEIPMQEIREYLFYLRNKYKGRKLDYLAITIDGEYVDLHYKFASMPIERLRRITGYLVSDVRFWNNAKRAEERDRVKHI